VEKCALILALQSADVVVINLYSVLEISYSVAYLEGGRAGFTPPPVGRRTDAVSRYFYMWQRCCIMATPSPVYLFKHVKHG